MESIGPKAGDEVHVEPFRRAKGESRASAGAQAPEARESLDRLLAELAHAQHGVVGRQQLLAEGVGRRVIGDRLRRGALHRICRGAYAVGHSRVSLEGRWMAAVLSMGPRAVLSHRTAAELWGMARRSSRAIEVTRPTHARRRADIVPHISALPDDERAVVAGIPVTSVPRTILDFAAVEPKREVERVLNEAEVHDLTDPLSVPDLLERYPRRRGSAVLRRLLADEAQAAGITRNDLEEGFVALLDAHGLPRPRFNADLAVAGRFISADCLWLDERVIVELDGRAVHGTARAFEADRERDRLLLVDGWRVVRVTWRQLRDQRDAIAADLRKALARPRALR